MDWLVMFGVICVISVLIAAALEWRLRLLKEDRDEATRQIIDRLGQP